MNTLSDARSRLYAAVLSDVLDSIGLRNQAMESGIRALDTATTLCGHARTGVYMEVFEAPRDENPYELEIALVDALKPGEVAVLCTGNSERITPWGELLTTAALARGATGCVTDGMVRDTAAIRELRFPVFHRGSSPLDSAGRGKVVAIDVKVQMGGVAVRPGDLLFGDGDGIVVVPREVEDEVLSKALVKIAGENTVRQELAAGEPLATVFRRHGIL